MGLYSANIYRTVLYFKGHQYTASYFAQPPTLLNQSRCGDRKVMTKVSAFLIVVRTEYNRSFTHTHKFSRILSQSYQSFVPRFVPTRHIRKKFRISRKVACIGDQSSIWKAFKSTFPPFSVFFFQGPFI